MDIRGVRKSARLIRELAAKEHEEVPGWPIWLLATMTGLSVSLLAFVIWIACA